MNLKSLAKDTAIYGLSSIVGRFLNYLLVVLYSYKIPAESGGYGIVSNLYAWTALLLAVLTFGMETTFFRFAGKEGADSGKVYGNSLKMVGCAALVFLAAVFSFLRPVSSLLGYSSHPEYIACFAVITALDAFQAIMFARLRQQKRPLKFVFLKMSFIFASILLNVFVFCVLPLMFDAHPVLEQLFVRYDYGVGFIFFINLICTSCVTLGFIPELRGLKVKFDRSLCVSMLGYTWPLLLLSLMGILNQVADKILFPYLMPGHDGMVQLGIYGACAKIAMIMAILTQAFRYAYEPIVFGGVKDRNSKETLADGMKYYVIFTLLAFLAVVAWMPVLKYLIGSSYWAGLEVVPVVMAAEICMGVYFNLSFWYKLSDRTWWGAVISAVGAVVMIAVNIILVPKFGYWACAWGGLSGYGVSMVMSAVLGHYKYPIPYDFRTMAFFIALASILFAALELVLHLGWGTVPTVALNSALVMVFCIFIFLNIRKKSQQDKSSI